MKVGIGVVAGAPRAAAFPTLLRHRTFRCFTSRSSYDHVSYIKDVAATQPPEHLPQLLRILHVKGESIISPAAKQDMIPLAIPLSRNNSGSVTALLRWPTAPSGMEMPVVEVRKYGVWLLAKNVDQFIHRILVEEDAKSSQESNNELFGAAADTGKKLYKRGDLLSSNIKNLDIYLLKKVGMFPDLLERRVLQHFGKGDHLKSLKMRFYLNVSVSSKITTSSKKLLSGEVSAMVTGEFYIKKEHFPGFGRPFVFNAEILLKVGRKLEAKDAARGALKSPWWTLGCKYQEVADIAEWDDEQIEFIKEKVSEVGKEEDLKKGKDPAQIALDEAAFLLDLASIEGTWDASIERIAECYKVAGLDDMAKFVLHRD